MPSMQASYPQVVNTANGTALLYGRFTIKDGAGLLVRHRHGQEINLALCQDVRSQTDRGGWLVVYREDEVTNG
jgi:hypothetical protein